MIVRGSACVMKLLAVTRVTIVVASIVALTGLGIQEGSGPSADESLGIGLVTAVLTAVIIVAV